jgi:hypothetical protein
MIVKRKLLDQVSDVARFRHLSLRTEEAYRNCHADCLLAKR